MLYFFFFHLKISPFRLLNRVMKKYFCVFCLVDITTPNTIKKSYFHMSSSSNADTVIATIIASQGDLAEVLGVTATTTVEELKRRHRRIAFLPRRVDCFERAQEPRTQLTTHLTQLTGCPPKLGIFVFLNFLGGIKNSCIPCGSKFQESWNSEFRKRNPSLGKIFRVSEVEIKKIL